MFSSHILNIISFLTLHLACIHSWSDAAITEGDGEASGDSSDDEGGAPTQVVRATKPPLTTTLSARSIGSTTTTTTTGSMGLTAGRSPLTGPSPSSVPSSDFEGNGVRDFMVSLGLQGYTSLLAQHGFDELDALAEEDPSNLISIGMLEADALSVVQHALLQTFANAGEYF